MDFTRGLLKGLEEYILKMQFWCKSRPPVDIPGLNMDFTRCPGEGIKEFILKTGFLDKSGPLTNTPEPKNGFYWVSREKYQRVNSENEVSVQIWNTDGISETRKWILLDVQRKI